MKRLLAFLLLLLHVNVFLPRASGQDILPLDKIMNQKDLDKTITALDAAVFDSYNKCDLQRFETFFVDDVEFYHDQGGVTLGKRELSDSVKRNICGQTTRELVRPESIASTTLATRRRWESAKVDSSTFGGTKTVLGRSRVLSVMSTIRRPSNALGG
jgi:uncharacterized protein DUF4440